MIRLLPDQISKLWDIIRYALEDSPPLTVGNINSRLISNILTAALSGEIDVWVSYTKEGELKLDGIILTSFEIDKFVKEKSLLIYYLYSYRDADVSRWIKGLKSLAKYAKTRNCSKIMAYTNVPTMINISEKLGGNIDTRFITFNLKD